MKLYRGVRYKVDIIKPAEVHPSDYSKFPKNNVPKKVVRATDNKLTAIIHALMDGYTYEFSDVYIQTESDLDNLFFGKMNDLVYIYEIPSEGFSQIGDSPEYYSIETINKFDITQYTNGELINVIKESGLERRVGNLSLNNS